PGRGRKVLVVLVPAVFDVVDGHAGAVAAGDGPRELGVDAVGGGVEVPLVVDERGGGGGGRPRRRRHQRRHRRREGQRRRRRRQRGRLDHGDAGGASQRDDEGGRVGARPQLDLEPEPEVHRAPARAPPPLLPELDEALGVHREQRPDAGGLAAEGGRDDGVDLGRAAALLEPDLDHLGGVAGGDAVLRPRRGREEGGEEEGEGGGPPQRPTGEGERARHGGPHRGWREKERTTWSKTAAWASPRANRTSAT